MYEARLTGHLKKSRISTLFTGSGSFVSTSSNEYDMLIVDEAHRLGLKSGLYRNLGENQIKEIINGSNLSIFFIDELQKIHIHDAGSKSMIRTMAEELGAKVTEMSLVSQFRCGGSNEFLSWLDTLLYDTENLLPFSEDPEKFELRVFDDPAEMHEAIQNKTLKERNHEWWQVTAGIGSAKAKHLNDIVLNNGAYAAQWNLTEHGSLWIEREIPSAKSDAFTPAKVLKSITSASSSAQT